MPKSLCTLIMLLLASGPVLAQEADEGDSTADAAATADSAPDAAAAGEDAGDESQATDDSDDGEAGEDEPVIDLDDPEFADLDRQTYEEDDDDFVPTEEIPADEAIPFPSDI